MCKYMIILILRLGYPVHLSDVTTAYSCRLVRLSMLPYPNSSPKAYNGDDIGFKMV